MNESTLHDALGAVAQRRQFFVYRLHSFDPATGKWKKEPVGGKDDHPARLYPLGQLMTFDEALRACTVPCPADEGRAVGLWIAEGSGLWFLDIDSVANMQSGYGAEAWQWACAVGCMFEYSSSGGGVHLLGLGALPEPEKLRNKWSALDGTGLELYDRGRGMCFGLTGRAWGRADAQCLPPDWAMVPRDDGSRVHIDIGDGAIPGFEGPDDETLIAMLACDASPIKDSGYARMFADGAASDLTVAQLWNGDRAAISARWPDARLKDGRCSEADLSLANIIAKHVGGDMARVSRLMWRSGLVRDVWHTNKGKVLRSARKAAQSVWNRSVRPVAVPALPVLPALPVIGDEGDEVPRGIEAARRAINNAGSIDELKAACVQVVGIQQWDKPDTATIAAWLKGRSTQLGAPWPIGVCRDAIAQDAPVHVPTPGGIGGPDWLADWVFEGSSGRYYNKRSGLYYATQSAEKMMRGLPGVPRTPNGKQANPLELFDDVEMWNGCRVDVMQYAPDMPDVFEVYGTIHGNTYRPDSVPVSGPAIADDVALIWNHIMRLCKGREAVAREFVTWCAWQVQRPGQLVRWAPLIIGRQGIGKGFLGEMMGAVIGPINCKIVQPSDIANSGGFTDWAYGRAVTVLDEVHIAGLEKYTVYNRMKPYLTNPRVTINRKGAGGIEVRNTTNYMGFSNFDDAVPLDEDDRRWLIIRAANLRLENGETGHVEYMKALYQIIGQRAANLRGWLMAWEIPQSWPTAPMMTEDKRGMIADSENYVIAAVRKHVRNGVFNLTDSYQQIKADAMLDGDRIPSKEALVKAAKQTLGMVLMRAKIRVNPVAGLAGAPATFSGQCGTVAGFEQEKKLYVDEKFIQFTPSAQDAFLRWKG